MMAVCSVCGGPNLSRTQRRKSVGIRRCCKCVQGNKCIRILGGDGYDGHDDHDPVGIDVDIVDSKESSFPQTQTEFGRSVHLDHGTCYAIKISADSEIFGGGKARERVAVIIKVDGEMVSPTPIQVGASRLIKGFTLSRTTEQVVRGGDNDWNCYIIKKQIAEFRAFSQNSSRRRREITNSPTGTIECQFYRIKLASMQPGTRRRNHGGQKSSRLHLQQASGNQARRGLMTTRQGNKFEQNGEHHGHGHKKPVADYSKPLGTCRLFICEQRVPTFGDYLPPSVTLTPGSSWGLDF